MVIVTVMRVLLSVLHVCMLIECEGTRVPTMLMWEMEEGTRGSGILYSTADVLVMSVVHGMRGRW